MTVNGDVTGDGDCAVGDSVTGVPGEAVTGGGGAGGEGVAGNTQKKKKKKKKKTASTGGSVSEENTNHVSTGTGTCTVTTVGSVGIFRFIILERTCNTIFSDMKLQVKSFINGQKFY